MVMDEEGEDHLDRSCDREPKKEVSVLHTKKRREANWIRNALHKNCLLRHVIEGKTEEMRREDDVTTYWMTLREGEDTGFHILWTVYRDIFA